MAADAGAAPVPVVYLNLAAGALEGGPARRGRRRGRPTERDDVSGRGPRICLGVARVALVPGRAPYLVLPSPSLHGCQRSNVWCTREHRER